MQVLRKLLDSVEPIVKSGPLKFLYPLYEANDTFLYNTGETATGQTHVRDALDTKRMMITVVIALIPCIFMACYNTGYQAAKVYETSSYGYEIDTTKLANVRYLILDQLGVVYNKAGDTPAPTTQLATLAEFEALNKAGKIRYSESSSEFLWVEEDKAGNETTRGRFAEQDIEAARAAVAEYNQNFYSNFKNPAMVIQHSLHGLLFFLPVYLVCMAAGGTCELLFAMFRGHEINEGFLVTGMLFPLTLPPNIPLWQVAIGIIFGVVIGKEIFGGTGRNFLNPALTARAFLYFSHAQDMSGNVWTAVDGYTGATALGAIANANGISATDAVTNMAGQVPQVEGGMYSGFNVVTSSWWDSFVGNIHGSMGETSALACLIGAAILIAARVGSWRIMLGVVGGAAAFSGFLYFLPIEQTSFHVSPWWHFVIGGFAFGTVFMATDPVSASMTQTGKWIYGALIGVMTILVRAINPAFPEGIMLAILFANVFAPLIDFYVVQANIKRRMERREAVA